LIALQLLNGIIGFIEEKSAGDAIAALKSQLAPMCHACRDGEWKSMPAKELVPGDLIELKLGDVIPADCILLDGKPLTVDQAALTGESLPVTIEPWGHVKMGSAVKKGEIHAVVGATGPNTFFGKAAGLISSVESHGHLNTVILNVTMGILLASALFVSMVFIMLMSIPQPPNDFPSPSLGVTYQPVFLSTLSFIVVLIVSAIPIATQVVCTSTLGVGSHFLAKKKVIVARLTAIEELAGMTVLCSDKTGTLTLNKLSMREPTILHEGTTEDDITFYGALASKRQEGNQDAIDFCITQALSDARKQVIDQYKEVDFMPFNPTDKRTQATIQGPDGKEFHVSKGAPQVMLKLCNANAEVSQKVTTSVQEFADRGFRALGVAYKGPDADWVYVGMISLFDPPRADTKDTIAAAIDNGIEVKMVTGDQAAIARETCRELGMGSNILNTEVLNDPSIPKDVVDRIILEAHGFAEVLPEHKFQIVDRIRASGHVTGMTGDGVNDAPALKRADIGIAVDGATDAARAAADIVLTTPGLSVIIEAIFQSRMIFQRMRNYMIYRIAASLQILLFFFWATAVIRPDSPQAYNGIYTCPGYPATYCAHAPAFLLPVLALVIITVLNDGCMITISSDRVTPEKKPQKWDMGEIWYIASVLGIVTMIASCILLAYSLQANYLNPGTPLGILMGSNGRNFLLFDEVTSVIYLQISINDFLTIFSARTRCWFWERPVGIPLLIAGIFALALSTIFTLWNFLWGGNLSMASLVNSNGAVITVWVYAILWWLLQDILKNIAYVIYDNFFKSAEQIGIENYAKHHSLEYTQPDETGRVKSTRYLPSGSDLHAILDSAKIEHQRVSAKRIASMRQKTSKTSSNVNAVV
jgi:H+-transporting ATPase